MVDITAKCHREPVIEEGITDRFATATLLLRSLLIGRPSASPTY